MEINLILFIISCYFAQTSAKCPSAELILPCSCLNNAITCGGRDYYNLKNIFLSLSSALNDDEKHFDLFTFTNTAIHEFERNVFYGITFEEIGINSAYNLTQINSHAFLSTSASVKRFHIRNTPYGCNITDSNNIFNALNAMINVEYIYFLNTSLTAIPSHAFTNLTKLQYLYIEDNRYLKSIGDYAFHELISLSTLLLYSNPIEHFSEHTLSFRNTTSGGYLRFSMFNLTNINSNSFSSGALTAIKRPFIFDLTYFPALKYLDEKIFKEVLDNRNRILLRETILECDCRMYWLYKNEVNLYEDYVTFAMCTDGGSVFDHRPEYDDCNAQ